MNSSNRIREAFCDVDGVDTVVLIHHLSKTFYRAYKHTAHQFRHQEHRVHLMLFDVMLHKLIIDGIEAFLYVQLQVILNVISHIHPELRHSAFLHIVHEGIDKFVRALLCFRDSLLSLEAEDLLVLLDEVVCVCNLGLNDCGKTTDHRIEEHIEAIHLLFGWYFDRNSSQHRSREIRVPSCLHATPPSLLPMRS